MVKLFYVPSLKITYKIAEDVVPGNHIMVQGSRYELLNKRPLGRRVKRNLVSVSKDEKIILFS